MTDSIDWLAGALPEMILPPYSQQELERRALTVLFDRTQPDRWRRNAAKIVADAPPYSTEIRAEGGYLVPDAVDGALLPHVCCLWGWDDHDD